MDEDNVILALARRVEQGELSSDQALGAIRAEADAGTITIEMVQLATSHGADVIRSHSRLALTLTELCYAASAPLPFDASGRAALLLNLGSCCLYLEQVDRAKRYLDQVLPLARSAGDVVVEASAITHLVSVEVSLGQYAAAHARLREALPLCTQLGDDAMQVGLLKIEGSLHRREGNRDDALVVYHEALAVIRETGRGTEHEAGLLGNIANVLDDLKQTEEALRYYRDGVEVARRGNDWRIGLKISENLAHSLAEHGQPAEAAAAYEGAAECANNAREPDRAAGYFEEAARCWSQVKELDRAAAAINQGLALAERTGNRKHRLALLQVLVGLRAEQTDWAGALAACQNGLAVAQQGNDIGGVLKFLNMARMVNDITKNEEESIRLTQTAVELAFTQPDPKLLAQALGSFSEALPLVEMAHAVRHGRQQLVAAIDAVHRSPPPAAATKSAVLLICLLSAENSRVVYLLGSLLMATSDRLDNFDRVNLAIEYGLAAMRVGDPRTAHQQFAVGLEVARATRDDRAQTTLLDRLGVLYRNEGRFPEARQALEESLSLRDAGSADVAFAYTLGNLANTCADLHDLVTAERHFRRVLEIHRREGHEPGVGHATMNLAELHLRKRENAAAIPLLHEALAIFARTGQRAQAGNAYTSLTIAHIELGDAAKVREYSTQALALCRELGNTPNEARLLTRLGQWYRSLGDHGRALQNLDVALTLAEQVGNIQVILIVAGEVAEVRAKELKDVAGAVAALDRARAACRKAGQRLAEVSVLIDLADVFRAANRHADARAAGVEVYSILEALWCEEQPGTVDPATEAVWACLRQIEDGGLGTGVRELNEKGLDRSRIEAAIDAVAAWFKTHRITGPFDAIRGELARPSDPADAEPEPPSLQRHVLRFVEFLLANDLTTDQGTYSAFFYVSENPDLLADGVDDILVSLLGRLKQGTPEFVATLYARSLVSRCRESGLEAVRKELLPHLPDKVGAGEIQFVINFDRKPAHLSLPDTEENQAHLRRLHAFFGPTGSIDLKTIDEQFPQSFLDMVPVLIEQAVTQGATAVAERLRSIRPSVRYFKQLARFVTLFSHEDVNLFSRLFRILGLPSLLDRRSASQSEPDLFTDDAERRIRAVVAGADDDDWRAWVVEMYDELLAERAKESREAAQPSNAIDNAMKVIADSPRYALARRLATGELTWAEAVRQLGPFDARDAMASILLRTSAHKEGPATGAYYVALAAQNAESLDLRVRLFLANAFGVAAVNTGVAREPAAEALVESLRLIETCADPDEYELIAGENSANLAMILQHLGRTEEAFTRCEKAEELAWKLGGLEARLSIFRVVGEVYYRAGERAKATASLKQALTAAQTIGDRRQVGRVHSRLGDVFRDTGSPGEALGQHEKALEAFRAAKLPADVATALDKVGSCYRLLRQPEKARAAYQEAIDLYRSLNDRAGEAITTANLGNVERDLGDPAAGLACYVRALEIDPNASEWNRAIWIGNQGAAYEEMHQRDRAVRRWEEALPMHRRVGDLGMTAACLLNLAGVDRARGDVPAAITKAEEALRLIRKTRDAGREAQTLLLLGQLARESGRTADGEQYWRDAAAAARAVGDRLTEARIVTALGDAEAERGDTSAASASWEEALTLAAGLDPQLRIELLTTLARHHSREGGDHARALVLCREAIARVEELRQRLPRADQRRAFFGRFAKLYDEIVCCLLNFGFFEEAFAFCERMKTRTLSDLLAQKEIVPRGVPEPLAVRYRELLRRVQRTSPPDEDEAVWQRDRQALDAVLDEVRQHDPDFAALWESRVVELGRVRQQLPPGAVLVEFALLRQGAVVFIVPGDRTPVPAAPPEPAGASGSGLRPRNEWVAESGLHVLTLPHVTLVEVARLLADPATGWLPVYEGFQAGQQQFRQLLATLDRVLGVVHQQLLAPVLEVLARWDSVKSLVFVPHRGLHALPLDAAWDQPRDVITGGRNERRYVRDRYAVSYAPSATVWTRATRPPEGVKLLALGNPTVDLEFSEREVEAIGRLLSERAVILKRADATRRAVLDLAPAMSHLHFSCHGTFDRNRPTQSGLLLAEAPLTVGDMIDELRLAAGAVVVLSACETGRTDHTDLMDEYTAIASGFLYAGAGTVVSTLWPVDDLSTLVLMEHFYTGLRDHHDTCRALREAQAALRSARADELMRRFAEELPTASDRFASLPPDSRPFAHPYYWAGFIVTGVASL